jgi:hypothetical protein
LRGRFASDDRGEDRVLDRMLNPITLMRVCCSTLRRSKQAAGGVLAIALAMMLVPCGTVVAEQAIPIKRNILALYDGAQEGDDAGLTRIHRLAEMPLNHLGFTLQFHDIRSQLPAAAEMQRYRGVLTWFAAPIADADRYLAWISQVVRMDVRYVILGDVGVSLHPGNLLAVNRLLALAGLRHTGEYVTPTLATRIVAEDPDLVGFECRLDPVPPDYPVIKVADPGARIGLLLETPKHDGRRSTAVVAVGGRGGYSALNYEFCHPRGPLSQGKWLINPFAFFAAALGLDDSPIPDTTTISGRRAYFSQLNSEGWRRASGIAAFRDSGGLAIDAVDRELIEPLQDLPTTVDLGVDEVARSGQNAGPAEVTLQQVLARTNVDLSSRPLRTGLSRFDAEYPSVSSLLPLTSATRERHIYAPMSDEVSYRQGPAGESGFSALTQTVANTDGLRRLKPYNVNYHAQAGEHPAPLRLVKEQLTAAQASALTPVSASRYAAIVDGFFAIRIERTGTASWRVRNRGALQTLRFDAADGREVDARASIGVIGQSRRGATLYVALDESVEPALVVLGPRRAGDPGLTLNESRWLVRNVVTSECSFGFDAQGYGAGAFSWLGAAPGRYMLTVSRSGEVIQRQPAEADPAGGLEFVLQMSAIEPLAVRAMCVEAGGAGGP